MSSEGDRNPYLRNPEILLQNFAAVNCAERGYSCSEPSTFSLSTGQGIADHAQNRRKKSMQEEMTKFSDYEAR